MHGDVRRRLADAAELGARLRDLERRRAEARPADPRAAGLPFIELRCGPRSGREGKVVKLVGRRFTFGRDQCSLNTGAEMVSRRHARLELATRGWLLRDLDSSNGTYLNGERVVTASVRIGDIVTLGKGGAHYKVVGLDRGPGATA